MAVGKSEWSLNTKPFGTKQFHAALRELHTDTTQAPRQSHVVCWRLTWTTIRHEASGYCDTTMSILDAVLRVLGLPKLFVVIVKRSCITTFNWLRCILSFWKASTEKWKRKHFLKDDALDCLTPITSIAGQHCQVRTIQCSEVGGSAMDRTRTIVPTLASATLQSLPIDRSNVGQSQSSSSKGITPASNPRRYPPAGARLRELQCCAPPFRKPLFTAKALYGILRMLFFPDHPGIIGRCIKTTQARYEQTQVIGKRSGASLEMMSRINLLATILLGANIGFLSIPSIDQQGLTYWPERLRYVPLLCALGSIMMGIAVPTPRLFVRACMESAVYLKFTTC
ncbi:hypothetical protein PISMIDRAFT_686936 [Pisolithus microcarpus 441]|uniref:Uncharacterized protein n=1 Tax=Pisolithus microcarpus 441 TaxID=765257 RepID=A0A0C9XU12_9AGAM|nr:hypothetical protein PISMIDRAFT_686936 [Pisolithus microcarpus 441]